MVRQLRWKTAAEVWQAPTGALPGIRRTRLRMAGLALLAVAVLIVIEFWTEHAVWESLNDMLAEKMQSILDADLAALDLWVKAEMAEVKSWAESDQVRKLAGELAATAGGGGNVQAALLRSPAQTALRATLHPGVQEIDDRGYLLFDPTGRVLAAHQDRLVGLRLTPAGMAMMAGIFEKEVRVFKPFMPETLVAEYPHKLNEPLLASAALVRDDEEETIAVLTFLLDPEENFTRILSVARLGQTGDTYVFDKNGLMLSDSRFEEQLKEIGLIPTTPDARSILHVQIRDPGGDLTRGYRSDVPPAALPFTRMAAAAVSGQDGMDLKGYRDYRGVRVIGAWRWLPEMGIGIATEVGAKQAFGLLRPLRIAFYSLIGLLVIAAGAILLSSYSLSRMQRRMEQIRQLGQYTLVQKIGEGGMGTVYKARHAMLRRPTAVKLLNRESATPESIARFEREVQFTSQLTHPNTVEIYDYGRTSDGIFYYAMEYLPGLTLARLVETDGAVTPGRVIYILRQICASLEEAHERGLIHRDIKPLNVILCERGRQADFVKVLDFGLVKDVVTPEQMQITMPEMVAGTPLYVAPERLRDPDRIDARSDIYSIGVIGFNLLTGRDTFTGRTVMEVCQHVMHSTPPRPSQRAPFDVPDVLDQLIVDCLARDPADRPQSVTRMIEILDSIPEASAWGQREARQWWQENAARIAPAAEKAASEAPVRPARGTTTVEFPQG